MTVERDHLIEEREQHLGLTTLEIGRVIVSKIPQIQKIYFRHYYYVPNKPSGEEESVHIIDRQAFLHGKEVEGLIEKMEQDWNICFDSRIENQEGKVLRLPMMDLALSKSPENLERTKQRLREKIVPDFGGGFILETKKSYHFFGEKPFNQEKWNRFLGLSLLTSIVTVMPDDKPNIHEIVADYRYIGYSLLRDSTGLRITTNGSKTFTPRVVAVI